MKNQFVPYEFAIKLKELGFDEECLTKWGVSSLRLYGDYKPCSNTDDIVLSGDLISAPLWQQAFDWFREKHNFPNWIYESDGQWYFKIVKGDFWIEHRDIGHFKTYQEARKACLEKLIEICEQEG